MKQFEIIENEWAREIASEVKYIYKKRKNPTPIWSNK